MNVSEHDENLEKAIKPSDYRHLANRNNPQRQPNYSLQEYDRKIIFDRMFYSPMIELLEAV